jgi:hypothetical protein
MLGTDLICDTLSASLLNRFFAVLAYRIVSARLINISPITPIIHRLKASINNRLIDRARPRLLGLRSALVDRWRRVASAVFPILGGLLRRNIFIFEFAPLMSFSMLRNALDLDYALDHLSIDRGFDSARISALVKADVTDVADFFDLLTDRAVKGKKTIISEATIDINVRDTMRVRPAEHWFTSTNRIRGVCGRSGDREDQRYPVHPKPQLPISAGPRH